MVAACTAGSTLFFNRPFSGDGSTMMTVQRALLLDDKQDMETVVPFRSESDLENDLQCFRDQLNRRHIHFVHMRKAGGTRLVSTLEKEQEKPEGERTHFFHSEGLTYNVSCFENNDPEQGGMVHLTSLRDPVQRIISSYFYEGRLLSLCGNYIHFAGAGDQSGVI